MTEKYDNQSQFTLPLLQWYHHAGRDLPWRQTKDPYAVWVSEIMLQQTQVSTVLSYYKRFLSAFPTIQALASAPLDQVLNQWQGLGYYARARHLHRAARVLMDQFEGTFPVLFEAVYALPGIGRSTAGAILTIAFGQRHPILDGNVRRVLCRFFAIKKEPHEKDVETWLWNCSRELLPKCETDHYLQAIMDLGATICTPARPKCKICPVIKACCARQQGIQETLPIRRKRKKNPHFDYVVGVILYREEVLIRQRPFKGLLGGLWEFPGGRAGSHDPLLTESRKKKTLGLLLREEENLTLRKWEPWMEIEHAFTHFKMTLHVFTRHMKKRVEAASQLQWISKTSLPAFAFSSAHQKIVDSLQVGRLQPERRKGGEVLFQ
ncbi:MAG: A/G-specific adenine glycosylase [Nitrospiria bacterium]